MYGAIGVGERGLITLNLVLYCSLCPDILYKKINDGPLYLSKSLSDNHIYLEKNIAVRWFKIIFSALAHCIK